MDLTFPKWRVLDTVGRAWIQDIWAVLIMTIGKERRVNITKTEHVREWWKEMKHWHPKILLLMNFIWRAVLQIAHLFSFIYIFLLSTAVSYLTLRLFLFAGTFAPSSWLGWKKTPGIFINPQIIHACSSWRTSPWKPCQIQSSWPRLNRFLKIFLWKKMKVSDLITDKQLFCPFLFTELY